VGGCAAGSDGGEPVGRVRTAGNDRRARRLTIGSLANAIGISKSGLYAHLGSKQELELATIEAAQKTFVAEVLRPPLGAPKGIQRLLAACEMYLSHIERRVFPGGCFFSAAAADIGSWPGPARDAIAVQRRDWVAVLELVEQGRPALTLPGRRRRGCRLPGRRRSVSIEPSFI
jgi:AcrR family transcriptional regulator